MLQVHYIRDHKEVVLAGLAKRNFKNADTVIDTVLKLDKDRRATQAALDNVLSESNTLSKDIGMLYKSGEVQKATLLKEKSAKLKDSSKQLSEDLAVYSNKLQDLLYTIPNIPHSSVKAGHTEADNEEVFSEGSIPNLGDNALPHWELAKKSIL
jgi:seryl-tRNA synthetase (EC 6.1.1.11)